MAGGTFESHNKIRPGAYFNVRSESVSASGEGVRGVVTMPIVADFGPVKEVIEVNSGTNFDQLFGEGLASDNLRLVGEALKGAATALLYRVNGGEKATGELASGINVTATHGGKLGNNIRVAVRANVDDETAFDVLTYLNSNLVDAQEAVAKAEDLVDNALVAFSGTGALTVTAGVTLDGGATEEPTSGDYADYLEAISVYEFNSMAITVEEEATKVAAANFVKRMRDDEGQKVNVFVGQHAGGHEAVNNIGINGVVLADGTILTPEQTTAYFAGASAAAGVNESLTYHAYPGAVDVHPRLKSSEITEALKRGEMVMTLHKGQVVLEQDINSLIEFTIQKNQNFRKNRVLRVLDAIQNDSKEVFLSNFVGRVDNHEDGRGLFKANRVAYFNNLQAIGAIEEFTAEDITIRAGEGKDEVVMDFAVKPVDAMEKLYGTVKVQ